MSAGSKGKSGTRVFKKSSANGKITTYLGKRDYVDHKTHIDPIDGVVLLDPDYLKDRKVFARLVAIFRYGREELDVLGLKFRKELFLSQRQIYPPLPENERPLTRLQTSLTKKLGDKAYPFVFELTKNSPFSVCLQPAQSDIDRKPCGVEYSLHTFIGDHINEVPSKRRSVELAVRKVSYAPRRKGVQPSAEVFKEFLFSKAPLRLEATLDKDVYHHGETISVNVHVSNQSSKTVKRVTVTVFQFADIQLFETGSFKSDVAKYEATSESDGMPVRQNQVLTKVFKVKPVLENNKNLEKRGLALDGKLKHEDTNLASSTSDRSDVLSDEELGITVKYKVEVKVELTEILSSSLSVELPFVLSQPPPPAPEPVMKPESGNEQEVLDPNLIKFDTSGAAPMYTDEDLLFEDFTRMCVKGTEGQGTET
ncbi:beta-arrestin-1-like [Lytechinus pictus]|uniref:beta-arrestin-1-like n=1 Tax=Lytechinus pictus TaxID=7653 RepID=UPI0030B9FBA3